MSVDYHEVEGQVGRRKWVRNSVIGLMVLVVVFVVWRTTNASRVNRSLAALQKAGYPTTMEDLERQYYPVIPPEENAAWHYNQVLGLLNRTNRPNGSSWFFSKLPRTGELWPSNDMAKILRAVEDNQAVLAALRSNFPANGSRYPLNFSQAYGMVLPHLAQITEGVRLLVVDAALKSDAGKTVEALDDLDAAFRLSQSLRDEPILISQLVRLKYRTMISMCVERMLNRAPLTEEQLTRLGKLFARDDNPTGLEHAIAGEICMGSTFFTMPAKERAALFASPDSATSPAFAAFAQGLMNFSGLMDRDYDFYLSCMTEHLRISKLPFPERLDAAEGLDERMTERSRRGFHMISSLILPAISGLSGREAENAARLRVVQAVLAVERYRLANGDKLPEHLKDLTPAYLADVPKDPFDGGPLRYRKLAPGYIVYSVGRNKRDDGGEDKSPERSQVKDDITFTVGR